MAIQHWDPIRDIVHLQEKMNRLFEDALARSGGAEIQGAPDESSWAPAVDLAEMHDRFVLRADLAGVAPSDVDLQVEDGNLRLRGERKLDPTVARESYLRMERPYGRFSLQLELPSSVDPQGILASQRDGVLEIVLPKMKGRAPNRVRVEVK